MLLQTDFESSYQPTYQPQPRRRGLNQTHKGIILWHVFLAGYYLCSQLCGASAVTTEGPNLFDLSHEFDNTTIYWVTAKPLTLTLTHNGTRSDGVWLQSDEISAATHGGTHMDAPCHFAKGRWCVSDIPLERLVAKAAVVDISNKVQNNPDMHLTKEDLVQWEKTHGRIPQDSLLLVRTGWSRFWPDPETYSGTVQREVTLLRFPSILPEAADWLVTERDIVGVGIDTMSIDIPATASRTHTTLMERNIYGLENVNIPAALPPTGATVFVMPMKLKYASGAPVRIFAQVAKDASSNAPCLLCSPSMIMTMVAVYFCYLLWTNRFD